MGNKWLFFFLVLCVPLFARAPADSTDWYSPWQQKIEQCASVKELNHILATAEQQFRNQPLRLLRIEYLYTRNYYDVLRRNMQAARSKQEQKKFLQTYGTRNQSWEKLILRIDQVAARVDSIRDEDLYYFARSNHLAAQRIRFYSRLKKQGLPNFAFVDLQGNKHRFAEFKGKYILIFFWNRHSVPCTEELSYLVKAQQTFPQLRIIGIYITLLQNPMEKEIVLNLIKEKQLNWIHIYGAQATEFKKQFFVRTFPTILFFDRQQRLLNEPLDLNGSFQNEKLLSTLKKYIKN